MFCLHIRGQALISMGKKLLYAWILDISYGGHHGKERRAPLTKRSVASLVNMSNARILRIFLSTNTWYVHVCSRTVQSNTETEKHALV